MALTVKADAQDLPSIFQILGLGGPPPDEGQAPPIDSSLAGAPGTPEPTTEQKAVPTKLGRLNQIIAASQGAADHPLMTDEHSSPNVSAQPRSLSDIIGANGPDPSQLVAAAQGNNTFPAAAPDAVPATSASSTPAATTVQKSWAQQHPTLMRILKGAATTAEGGAAGAGSMTFGEGFQRAHELTDPIRKEMEHAALAEKAATTAHTKAATEQMQSQVTLPNGLTVPFALAQKLYPTLTTEHGKDARNQANIDSREGIAGDKNAIALRKQGLKLDANGKQVPLTRDEMSETEQASLDLKQSQQEAAAARAELDRNKNKPDSPAYKTAMGRLAVAQQNANTAAGRLGIETKKYLGDYFGTDSQGNALPGVDTDAQGRPIGTRVSNAGKIPADRLKRGDLASNAISNLDDIVGMIHSNPELFGSLQGRITSVREMMGSDEPAIREIAIAAHNYALASAGVHGTRSQGAVEKTENELLNHWKDGDTAVLGGIAQAKKSLQQFVDNQQLGHKAIPAGGTKKATAQPQATHVYDPNTGTIAPVKH